MRPCRCHHCMRRRLLVACYGDRERVRLLMANLYKQLAEERKKKRERRRRVRALP